jgi:hypothetical protein
MRTTSPRAQRPPTVEQSSVLRGSTLADLELHVSSVAGRSRGIGEAGLHGSPDAGSLFVRFDATMVTTTTVTSDEETALRQQAFEQLKKRRDFLGHLVVYVVVNGAVWVIWLLTGSGYPWPAWVTGAWAIGLLLNAWDVFGRRPITEAEIRREIERLRPQH